MEVTSSNPYRFSVFSQSLVPSLRSYIIHYIFFSFVSLGGRAQVGLQFAAIYIHRADPRHKRKISWARGRHVLQLTQPVRSERFARGNLLFSV